mgnify:CR=1 FL=1
MAGRADYKNKWQSENCDRINLVVKKYGGYINRQNEPGVFVTEIMLPL